MYIVQNIQAHKIIGHNTKCVTRDKVKKVYILNKTEDPSVQAAG